MSEFLGYAYMICLACQFGLQPILSRSFSGHISNRSLLVIAAEVCKFVLAFFIYQTSTTSEGAKQSKWGLIDSLKLSGVPACIYAIQNVLIQTSYQHLDPLIFNLINQTKLISTAVFLYVFLGKRFSVAQIGAMLMLLSASILLARSNNSSNDQKEIEMNNSLYYGILPVAIASMLSGVSAALTQRSLQTHQRNSALVTMELCVYGSVFLVLNMFFNGQLSQNDSPSMFEGWDIYTMIPIVCTAFGGIFVGGVTKYAGGIMKSFSLICGILLTGIVEFVMYEKPLKSDVWIALGLVTCSMYIYTMYPHRDATKKKMM